MTKDYQPKQKQPAAPVSATPSTSAVYSYYVNPAELMSRESATAIGQSRGARAAVRQANQYLDAARQQNIKKADKEDKLQNILKELEKLKKVVNKKEKKKHKKHKH